MRAVSFFSGIGGVQHGMSKHVAAEWTCVEADSASRRVLIERVRPSLLLHDAQSMDRLPFGTRLVVVGPSCFDLPFSRSRFGHVMRLVEECPTVEHLVVEDSPVAGVALNGAALSATLDRLAEAGFYFAHRVVDMRAFGARQSQRRLVIVASKSHVPSWLLNTSESLSAESDAPFLSLSPTGEGTEFGEGCTCTVRALHTPQKLALIPLHGQTPFKVVCVTPEQAEALQGLPEGWTRSLSNKARFPRIANSVCAHLFEWIALHLFDPPSSPPSSQPRTSLSGYGGPGMREWVSATHFPCLHAPRDLTGFSWSPPLSRRATIAYLMRTRKKTVPPSVRRVLSAHAHDMRNLFRKG